MTSVARRSLSAFYWVLTLCITVWLTLLGLAGGVIAGTFAGIRVVGRTGVADLSRADFAYWVPLVRSGTFVEGFLWFLFVLFGLIYGLLAAQGMLSLLNLTRHHQEL